MIEMFDDPGLIGGLIGLLLGMVDYAIYARLIQPRLLEANARKNLQTLREREARARTIALMNTTFLLSCFVAFPIVGFFTGRLILPDFGVGAGG